MTRSGQYRDAGLKAGFNVSTTDDTSLQPHAMCKREEVQHATTIIKPHRRPRPGRRRLSFHRLPFSSTQTIIFMMMIFSVFGMSTEAVEHAGSQSRAINGHYVDGRILFDQHPAPKLALHRRDDPASTNTASTTSTAEASTTSSSVDSSTTTTSLPSAFDGGFGTNYTQPSCPTFLRSMVHNATFSSCVPFSLLLQVRPFLPILSPLKAFRPEIKPPSLRTPCPSSTPPAPSPP